MSSKHAKTALLAGGIVYVLILMTQCKTKDDLERAYFRELVENIHHTQTQSNEDSDLVAALHLTHRLLAERQIIFRDQHFSSFQPYDGSLTGDILTAKKIYHWKEVEAVIGPRNSKIIQNQGFANGCSLGRSR